MHTYVVVVDVDAVRHQKVNIGLSIKNVTHDEKKTTISFIALLSYRLRKIIL